MPVSSTSIVKHRLNEIERQITYCMERLTQHQLILEYCKEFGKIMPAKVGGHSYRGGFLGSETSKRCRELRKKGQLDSYKDGKFEVFYIKQSDLSEITDLLKPYLDKQKQKILF